MTGVDIVECRAAVFFSLLPPIFQSFVAAGLSGSSLIIIAPSKKAVTSRRSPARRGVATLMPERLENGSDQYTFPDSGSSELSDSGFQTISCRFPPASIITGDEYPGSFAGSACH